MTFAYNYYDVFAMDADGRRVKVTTEMDPQIDFSKEILNTEKEPYVKKQVEHAPISTERNVQNIQKNIGGWQPVSRGGNIDL